MRRNPGLLRNEIQARDCLIRTAIGRTLVAQYDLAAPLSGRLAALLRRFEGADEIGALESPTVQCDFRAPTSAPRAAQAQGRNRHPPEAL
jgi:hypothetical protein